MICRRLRVELPAFFAPAGFNPLTARIAGQGGFEMLYRGSRLNGELSKDAA
jgi:2-methylisocitrate lyase-like PEP mutase family enzyme